MTVYGSTVRRVEHLPDVDGTCLRCGQVWPACLPARQWLLAEYGETRQALVSWLRYWFSVARSHRPAADAGWLYRQVVGWAEPPPGYRTNAARFAPARAGVKVRGLPTNPPGDG